jgi:predicted nuclease with TOPRIM domain
MRLFTTFAVVFSVLLASCAGSSSDERKDGYSEVPKNPEDSLFQDVMRLHDTAMSKMKKLANYSSELTSRIDSLKKTRSSAKESLTKKYSELRADLQQAETNMNTWMEKFSIDSAQDDTKRRIAYLESEKSKVSQVKDEILAALSKADSALKK